MIEIASKIVICLCLASFLGFLIGFLIGRASRGQTQKTCTYTSSHDFKVHGNIYNRPIILSKPRPTGKDDLKEIEGIDDKTEESLNQLGIFHFDQMAKWSKKNCQWVNEYLELEGRIDDENWVVQAQDIVKKR